MFFKKKGNAGEGATEAPPPGAGPTSFTEKAAEKREDPLQKGAGIAMTQQKPPSPGFSPEIPRRVVDIPGAAPRRPTPAPAPTPSAPPRTEHESKRLIVGRDIILSGEITACDVLVVEGRVEATLSNSHSIDIAATGHFKGTAEIEEADISGAYEGTLTVRNRLFVRSTGKVTGKIRYGQLEIERGGVVTGDIQLVEGAAVRPLEDKDNKPGKVTGTAVA
jgi:cytoskeletal protein CcmA (bactofilin family)